MKKVVIILFLALNGAVANAQQAPVIKLEKLQELIHSKDEKILVLNFWATWCGPCIAELPLFETLNASGRKDIEVALVSLDMDLDPDPEKVYKFISRKKLRSPVYVLDESDPNSWIDKIEQEWSGALPATIVINRLTGKRKFVGKELHQGDLEKLIAEVKN
jgi:thiol-disulfide isomerase/thioredoxin